MAKRSSKSHQTRHLSLIVSNERRPAVPHREGKRFQVVGVSLVQPSLVEAKKIAARLCGGTSWCLALVDITREGKKTRPEVK